MESNKENLEQPQNTDRRNHDLDYQGLSAVNIASHLEQTQIRKFHTKGGHGFAAEEANALANKIRFESVDMVGKNNSLNGPDRIVDNIPIQTKYYQTPSQTVGAAFDPQTGFYRYENQLFEVPSDQYEDCVNLMRQKILQRKVPGVTDPRKAERVIKKGEITYQQARNIARAGNIHSLAYDAKTQVISTSYIFAISFAIQFARGVWEGHSKEEALKGALGSAISVGSASFLTGIIASQILRSKIATMGTIAFRGAIKSSAATELGKTAIEKLAAVSLGRAVYGAAAVNHIAKLLRSNVITSVITAGVITIPDFYRAMVSKRISWKQFGKNLTINALSVAGGVIGWIGGATMGAITGSIIPIFGTVIGGIIGGLIGALTIALLSSIVAKFILDRFVEDDIKQMLRIVNKALEEVVFDFLLTAKEIDELLEKIKGKIKLGWLQDIYKIGYVNSDSDEKRKEFAYTHLGIVCQEIVAKRAKIYLPEPNFVTQEIINM